MNMRESGMSEHRFFFACSHSKTAISFNILLVLQILCLKNIFSGLKIHLHTYTINAVPFWYGAINDSMPIP